MEAKKQYMNDISDILTNITNSITDPKEREYFAIHQVRYERILNKISTLGLPKGAKILDIGCYPPHIYSALKTLGYDMYGISSTHEPMQDKNIAVLNIETDPFPWKKDVFDLVVMTEVIEHMTADPRVYMGKIRDVLKPGGKLLVTTINAVNLKNRALMLIGKSPSFPVSQLLDTKIPDGSVYYRHNREFTMGELEEILKIGGFSIMEKSYESFYTPFRHGRNAKILKTACSFPGFMLTRLVPHLRDSLMLVSDAG